MRFEVNEMCGKARTRAREFSARVGVHQEENEEKKSKAKLRDATYYMQTNRKQRKQKK
jgi:hypothetical protein